MYPFALSQFRLKSHYVGEAVLDINQSAIVPLYAFDYKIRKGRVSYRIDTIAQCEHMYNDPHYGIYLNSKPMTFQTWLLTNWEDPFVKKPVSIPEKTVALFQSDALKALLHVLQEEYIEVNLGDFDLYTQAYLQLSKMHKGNPLRMNQALGALDSAFREYKLKISAEETKRLNENKVSYEEYNTKARAHNTEQNKIYSEKKEKVKNMYTVCSDHFDSFMKRHQKRILL
jgi:hypothetical protein